MKFLPGQQVVVRGHRYPAKVLNYDRKDRYPFYNLETVGGNIFSTYEDQMELYTPDPQLTKLAEQLLDIKLFSVADANEFLLSLEEAPSSTTPQDAEEKEIQDILKCLGNMRFDDAFKSLVRVLVSNGTITLAQVKRSQGGE